MKSIIIKDFKNYLMKEIRKTINKKVLLLILN